MENSKGNGNTTLCSHSKERWIKRILSRALPKLFSYPFLRESPCNSILHWILQLTSANSTARRQMYMDRTPMPVYRWQQCEVSCWKDSENISRFGRKGYCDWAQFLPWLLKHVAETYRQGVCLFCTGGSLDLHCWWWEPSGRNVRLYIFRICTQEQEIESFINLCVSSVKGNPRECHAYS